MPIHLQYNFQLHYNIYIFLIYCYYIQNKFGKIASWIHISLIFLSMFVLHMHCTLTAATMNQFLTCDLARSGAILLPCHIPRVNNIMAALGQTTLIGESRLTRSDTILKILRAI